MPKLPLERRASGLELVFPEIAKVAGVDLASARGRVLRTLCRFAASAYDRFRGHMEDSPPELAKYEQLVAVVAMLRALDEDFGELLRLTSGWSCSGGDPRAMRTEQHADAWSMLAPRFSVAGRGADGVPLFGEVVIPEDEGEGEDADERVPIPFVAQLVDAGVRVNPDFLRHILHAFVGAATTTLAQVFPEMRTAVAVSSPKKKAKTARDQLAHHLGRIFDAVHAVERRNTKPRAQPLVTDTGVSRDASAVANAGVGERRLALVVLGLQHIAGGGLTRGHVEKLLDRDVEFRGGVLSPRLTPPPESAELDWEAMLEALARGPGIRTLGLLQALRTRLGAAAVLVAYAYPIPFDPEAQTTPAPRPSGAAFWGRTHLVDPRGSTDCDTRSR